MQENAVQDRPEVLVDCVDAPPDVLLGEAKHFGHDRPGAPSPVRRPPPSPEQEARAESEAHRSARTARAWAEVINLLARPYLTVLITTIYNAALLVAVWRGHLTVNDYMLAVGSTNAMVMGFWFGERSTGGQNMVRRDNDESGFGR